jgi:hypothetical protein
VLRATLAIGTVKAYLVVWRGPLPVLRKSIKKKFCQWVTHLSCGKSIPTLQSFLAQRTHIVTYKTIITDINETFPSFSKNITSTICPFRNKTTRDIIFGGFI